MAKVVFYLNVYNFYWIPNPSFLLFISLIPLLSDPGEKMSVGFKASLFSWDHKAGVTGPAAVTIVTNSNKINSAT